MNTIIEDTRKLIVNFSKDLYDRRLTDTSGGNVSVRIGDLILMTPSLAGTINHWNLRPEQILVLDLQKNIVEGEGTLSREAKVHYALYQSFYPEGKAVIHAHSMNILAYFAVNPVMPSILYNTQPYGPIPSIVDAIPETQELADNVVAAMKPRREKISALAAAVMAPRHGIFVVGKDLYAAFDTVERVDTNAFCLLQSKLSIASTMIG